jgi:hypothetical protein
MSLGAIFDHPKSVLARNSHDGVHICGLAIEMYRYDTPRARRDGMFNRLSANTPVAPAWVIIADVLIQECAVVSPRRQTELSAQPQMTAAMASSISALIFWY